MLHSTVLYCERRGSVALCFCQKGGVGWSRGKGWGWGGGGVGVKHFKLSFFLLLVTQLFFFFSFVENLYLGTEILVFFLAQILVNLNIMPLCETVLTWLVAEV